MSGCECGVSGWVGVGVLLPAWQYIYLFHYISINLGWIIMSSQLFCTPAYDQQFAQRLILVGWGWAYPINHKTASPLRKKDEEVRVKL